MNGLSLFTGSGIGELVLKEIIPGYRTVGYVEWDKFCQRLIQKRIADGVLDDAPIWGDVRTFDGKCWAGRVDFISAGFPCQPFSAAGKGAAADDERNQWPATLRIIREVRPRFVFLENVPALLNHEYFLEIAASLYGAGYNQEWTPVLLPTRFGEELRLFCIAAPVSSGGDNGSTDELLVRTEREEISTLKNDGPILRSQTARLDWAETESGVLRVVNGVADRMDRLKCLGNGWVPQVVARILTVRKD